MKRHLKCAVIFVAIASAGLFLLIGCSGDKSFVTGETKTREWFKEHHEERAKALAVCNEMSGLERRKYPNCKNAASAEVYVQGLEKAKIRGY